MLLLDLQHNGEPIMLAGVGKVVTEMVCDVLGLEKLKDLILDFSVIDDIIIF